MNFRQKLVSTTTLIVGVSMLAAPTAFAQAPASGPQTANPTAEEKKDTTEVEGVIVTGTRIRKSEFATAAPVQIITTEQTDLRGISDAATALLTSTTAASSFQINDQLTGFVTQGGGGTQSVALRGLGTQRTLTLLNGRRAGPAGTRGQVQAFDLNNIPQAQVERYEVLKDGASSIYGSDAVAGVVNVITKKTLNGGSVNVFASIPTERGGDQFRLDATYGHTFDKGYYNVSVGYQDNRVLRNRDRKSTACTRDYLFDPVTGLTADYINPLTGSFKCFNLNSDYVQVQFPTGAMNLVRTDKGYSYPSSANGNNSPVAGWARFARAGFPQTYLYQPSENRFYDASSVISPAQNASVTFTGGYFVSGKAEVYTELLYNRRDSNQYGAAQVFPTFGRLSTLFGAANLLPASNPNNTFGVNAVTVSTYASSSEQLINYSRAVLGLRGNDVNVGGIDWDYDVYAQYSLSDGMYDNGPRLYLDRFLATMSPNVACTNTPAGGNFSHFDCANLPNGVPWTSERVLLGNFSDQEKAFLFVDEQGHTTYTHQYVEGVLSTKNLFHLPAGDAGAAFGAQARREAINDIPGYNARNQNIALFTSAGQTKGSDTIYEAFAEVDLPILKDHFLFQNVDLDVSGRYSDYKSYGSTTTYKVGLNWAITDEYRLRASKGNSFRAPALYELYLGSQIGFSSQASVDPCVNYGLGNDPVIAASCAALGIAPDYTAIGSSSVPVASIGGIGHLKAETADTYNIGGVWTPKFAPISVAVDYFYTDIKNEVAQFGAFNIVNQCLRGQTQFCSLFTREAGTHFITALNNSYVNITEQKTAGVDLQLRWSSNLPWWNLGKLTVESEHSWKLVDKSEQLGGVVQNILGNTFNYNGPQYAGNLYANLDHGPFTFFYGIDAIGHSSDSVEAGGHIFANSKYADLNNGIGTSNCAATGNYCKAYLYETKFWFTQSASMRYKYDTYSFTVGMDNIANRTAPLINTGEFRRGTAMLNGYDMRGRRVFFKIGKTF